MQVFDLGLIDFKQAVQFQKAAFEAVKRESPRNALIICRHSPVITLGRSSDRKNILCGENILSSRGIEVCETDRGGDVTYHGPGQLIAYPIFNLKYFKKDIRRFIRYLEEIIIDLLSDLGISGERLEGFTGVWVNKKKIASIGIAIRDWIAFHGLSINAKQDDLENFKLIRPCGLDVQMTSIEHELGRNLSFEELRQGLIHKFSREVENG